jgi:uncharacterized protein (DUF58 family)
MTEVLENRNYLPLPFVHAKFMIGSGLVFKDQENISTSDQNYKNDIFSILFYQRVTRRLSFRCEKRGYYAVRTASIIGSDLFYTAHMVEDFPQNAYFYVYPGRVDLSRLEQPLRKMIGEVTSRTYIYPDPFEFRGIRAYTTSDPMNTINWKASARTNELMVNQYNSTTSRRIVILLNLEDEKVIRYLPLHEEAIRIAATLAARLLSEGFPVSLVTNGRDIESGEVPEPFPANGPAQTEDIYRILSRINLNLEVKEFFPEVRRIMEEPDFNTAGYVLISCSMKEPLQDAMAALSREASAIWVTPLYDNLPAHVDRAGDTTVINWEVIGHA